MFPVKAPTVCSDTTVIPSNLPTSSSTLFPGKMDQSITGGPSRRRAHTRHGNVGQLGSYAATAGYRWWHLHLQLRLNPQLMSVILRLLQPTSHGLAFPSFDSSSCSLSLPTALVSPPYMDTTPRTWDSGADRYKTSLHISPHVINTQTCVPPSSAHIKSTLRSPSRWINSDFGATLC